MIGIGQVVNAKYRLVRLLGDGGMGSVYEAIHEVLGTRVAIKVLHPELARRSGLVDRFLQEARVAAQIRSPHVVQVLDIDRTQDGQAYIVMELLEGEPLSTLLDRQRKLAITMACEYTIQILEGLEAAHALGVVHRDLKPENVFVTFQAGRPVLKLIDFGIAKLRRSDGQKNLTVAGVLMGTAEYMAPEQARSADQADVRSDIYAVGVMLYEMLAGTRPVLGDDARVIALQVERGEVRPLVQLAPEVPGDLAGLVHRAMAARPEIRFSTAAEMRMVLMARLGKGTGQLPAVAKPQDLGTGTLKGAPAAEVLAAAATRFEPRAGGTALGAPMGPQAMGPPAMGPQPMGSQLPPPMMAMTPRPPPMTNRRRRSSLVWLIAIPLCLGIGIVAALVIASMSDEDGPTATDSPSIPTPTPTVAPPTTNDASSGSSSGGLTPLEPLDPQKPTQRPTQPPATTTTRPTGTPTQPLADAGPPVILPPFTLPEGGIFPIPLPSTFPTVLPTTFPSSIPFPFPLPQPPGQPPAAAPAPTPTAPP